MHGTLGSPRLTQIMLKGCWAEVVKPFTAHILVGCMEQILERSPHPPVLGFWEEFIDPQHKTAQEQTSLYAVWAIIMSGLEQLRSIGTHGEVPSLVPFIPLGNLVSSPSQARNALVGEKFSYSCLEHTCMRSEREMLLLTMTPRWCTYMVSLSWRVAKPFPFRLLALCSAGDLQEEGELSFRSLLSTHSEFMLFPSILVTRSVGTRGTH